ncbi:MAG: hypothetical protein NTV51_12225 [Verrucomicrobia bacterium]|nr:hypothetical protein [Verrucomicrobiota bacterium]
MISRLFLLCSLLVATAAAQTAKTRVDLYAQIGSQLASNQAITAAQLRAVLQDVVASSQNIQTDGVAATAAQLAAHTANTGNPHAVTKAQVGLANVDNTSDANKPVSAATQAALDAKASASHSHANATTSAAGFMSAADKTKLDGISGTGVAVAWGDITGPISNQADIAAALAAKVPSTRTVAGKPLSSDVTLVKGDVGLGNVDNTSDANKPISSATQTALDAKAATSHTHLQEFGFILGDTTSVLPVLTSPARTLGKGGTIVGWYLRGDVSGSVTVDLDRAAAGGSFASIIGAGAKPSLSGAIYAAASSLSGWTPLAFSAGDSFRVRVTGTPVTLTQLTVVIVYQ